MSINKSTCQFLFSFFFLFKKRKKSPFGFTHFGFDIPSVEYEIWFEVQLIVSVTKIVLSLTQLTYSNTD